MEVKTEREKKYRITKNEESVLKELLSIKQLEKFKIGSIIKKTIQDKYFDTPEFKLLRNGLSLRIREEKNESKERKVQLKTQKGINKKLLIREEINIKIDKDLDNLLHFLENKNVIKETALLEKIEGLKKSRLDSVLKLSNKRRSRDIIKNGEKIGKMEIDQVKLDNEKFSEIEIESASEKHLKEIQNFSEILEKKFKGAIKESFKNKLKRGLELTGKFKFNKS